VLFGVVAFGLERVRIPVAPVILGLVLGPMVEQNFLTSMVIADGNFLGFFSRPIAAGLGVVAVFIWGMLLLRALPGIGKRMPAVAPEAVE
jgi:TctA family transporter